MSATFAVVGPELRYTVALKRSSTRVSTFIRAGALAPLFIVSLTHAQTDNTSGRPDAAAAVSASQSDALAEIVVTARKREERSLDVPASVQAVTASDLEKMGVQSGPDLVGNVSGISLNQSRNAPGRDYESYVIRGVGAGGSFSPAVAVILDGVYVPGLAFDSPFLDVERVEVLRGPQGSLFGRNTEGGAINIVLRRPDEVERGKFSFGYDNFNTATAVGSLSGPLADQLFGGVAMEMSTTDGFLKNPTLGQQADDGRNLVGRVSLRYKPGNDFDVNLAVDTADTRENSGLPGVVYGSNSYDVNTTFQIPARYKNSGGALTIDRDFSFAKLTAITGYRSTSSYDPFNYAPSPQYPQNVHDLRSQQTILSQELRLAGNSVADRLSWLLGAYGYREIADQQRHLFLPDIPQYPPGLFIPKEDADLTRKGLAAFFDASFKVTEQLEVDAGGRYSWDGENATLGLDYTIPSLLTVSQAGQNSVSNTAFTPTLSVLYRLSSDLSAYARYAEGYKAGGMPLAAGTVSTWLPFKPERSKNYELGLKGDVLDRRVSFDGSVYFIKIADQQVQSIVFIDGNPNLPATALANAARSQSAGFDLSVDVHPLEHLTLTGSGGYTRAKYLDYVDELNVQRSGEQLPYVPRWTSNASAEYRFPIRADKDIGFLVSYRHIGEVIGGTGAAAGSHTISGALASADPDEQHLIPEYGVVGVKLSLISTSQRWRVDLFADNLLDKYATESIFNMFFFTPNGSRVMATPIAPRRVGVRAAFEF
jgi:iron complex outermembrane receptor protein